MSKKPNNDPTTFSLMLSVFAASNNLLMPDKAAKKMSNKPNNDPTTTFLSC